MVLALQREGIKSEIEKNEVVDEIEDREVEKNGTEKDKVEESDQ